MKTHMKRWFSLFLSLLLVFAVPFGLAEDTPMTDEEYDALEDALEGNDSEMPILNEFRVNLDPNDLSAVEGLDENWVNILLLGTDEAKMTLNYGRTDTMIIMSVNKSTGKIRLSSLVRDMYVTIPGFSRQHRLNVANTLGGPLLVVKTVNETFGLNIKHYVSINFYGFKNVIDRLGGVELTLKSTESQEVKIPHVEGPQVLNGEQALAYVRIRKLDDNFARNERQRKLLDSLFNKMLKESTMDEATEALMESIKYMATNLSLNDLLTLVVPIFSGMEGMETTGFPVSGDYQGQMIEEASVIIFDQEATKAKLHAYIYGE